MLLQQNFQLICETDYVIKYSIRKIADMLSAKGYYTVVPKLLDPTMDGREGGDGEDDNKNENKQ